MMRPQQKPKTCCHGCIQMLPKKAKTLELAKLVSKATLPHLPPQKTTNMNKLLQSIYNFFYLYQSVQAVITKYHKPCILNNRHLFLILLEAGSPRSRSMRVQFLVRALFLICGWPLCPHMTSSWCICGKREHGLSLPPLIRLPVLLDQSPNLKT